MRKQNLAIVTAGVLVASRALAGSLDPTNAPGSTMHTLEEIYQKQVDTYQKVNSLVAYTNVTAAVPQTGQTNSYQAGDDGSYRRGVAWPNPRFTVQADSNCVLDNMTGLTWARNANLGITSWSNAVVFCTTLTNYGGYSDWRLPNLRELQSLVVYRWNTPALCNVAGTGHWAEGDPFVNVQNGTYWTGTSCASNFYNAWYVHMNFGIADCLYKTNGGCVWPVRGGQ